jgi:hypothetical protein
MKGNIKSFMLGLNVERCGDLSMNTSTKLFHPVFIGVFFVSMAI